ncbi:3'-5' exonuclease, partial [Shewanella indica]|uniref:3'-5' exonuclease n=1 Tax=Shewanella indica TaxID=768528 RepID=UPI00300566F2
SDASLDSTQTERDRKAQHHIPHKMPNQAVTNVEEERRLLYVAMTRAKSNFALLWRIEPTEFIVSALDSIQESDSDMYERITATEMSAT